MKIKHLFVIPLVSLNSYISADQVGSNFFLAIYTFESSNLFIDEELSADPPPL
jgi:hypothetical protein